MIGWPVSLACAVACRMGLLSQQPVRPQVRHCRRCIQSLPISMHVSQTSSGGATSVVSAQCGHGSEPASVLLGLGAASVMSLLCSDSTMIFARSAICGGEG